jgi:hypothetical protein
MGGGGGICLTLSLTGGGGPIGLPLLERPVAQKVMKLKKFGKISYSMEIVLAVKLSSGVPQKKPLYMSNSWLFRPNPKFGGQNIASVR